MFRRRLPFKDVLRKFKAQILRDEAFALLHIDCDILKAFQVSGALPFGIRPLSRMKNTLIVLTIGRLPEFLNSFEYSYTPTSEVFTSLESNIKAGTVILFDELYNYPSYADHEWKAFQEFLARTGKAFEPLAFNINHEQVVVRIK